MMGGRRQLLLGVALLGAFAVSLRATAAPWETLPPDHWAYPEIRWLQTQGYLRSLDPSQKPYTRGEIAAAIEQQTPPAVQPARDRFGLLKREFSAEMKTVPGWRTCGGGRVFIGEEARHGNAGREAGYGVLDAGVGNARMGIFTALRADRDLAEDPSYQGKIWGNFAGLTEQAYFTAVGDGQRWTLKLGRDHLWWGPGDDHLLLNDNRRGLDQISVQVRWSWGSFTALIGQVNDAEDSTGVRVSRFLSGHRLELLPWNWLRIGLSETLLFTSGIRFGSLNPFLPYYGELVNENSEGNGLMGLDFIAYPLEGTEVYGELLLDDIQLERKDPSDLEPTEWGWLIGGRWIGLDGLLGAGILYEGVTNRTYNALEPKYRYLNYGLPLGSDLGNDGDLLRGDVFFWLNARWRGNIFWQYQRRGEGGVSAPFDTTYMAYSLAEGYDESFPSGVVEKTHTWGLEMSALLDPHLQIEGWIGRDWITNAGHFRGAEESGWQGRITFNVRVDHLVKF